MGALTSLILNDNVGNKISNVGNGTSNPNTRLYISTNAGNSVNSFAIRVSSGGGVDESGLVTLIGLGAESD
jgi:hypothetical protein